MHETRAHKWDFHHIKGPSCGRVYIKGKPLDHSAHYRIIRSHYIYSQENSQLTLCIYSCKRTSDSIDHVLLGKLWCTHYCVAMKRLNMTSRSPVQICSSVGDGKPRPANYARHTWKAYSQNNCWVLKEQQFSGSWLSSFQWFSHHLCRSLRERDLLFHVKPG